MRLGEKITGRVRHFLLSLVNRILSKSVAQILGFWACESLLGFWVYRPVLLNKILGLWAVTMVAVLRAAMTGLPLYSAIESDTVD